MSIDFLILVISYLAVVVFIHNYITNNTIETPAIKSIVKPVSNTKKIDLDLESQGGSAIFTEEELTETIPEAGDEYLKYFHLEDSNKDEKIPPFEDKLLKEYASESFGINNIIEDRDTKSELDQYFKGLQVDTVSFKTDTIPSGKSIEPNSGSLLGSQDNSNDVSAFDEFSYSQYSSNYAPIF